MRRRASTQWPLLPRRAGSGVAMLAIVSNSMEWPLLPRRTSFRKRYCEEAASHYQ